MQKGFHHVAFACRDPEATRHFYEDLLGFALTHTELEGDDKARMKHLFLMWAMAVRWPFFIWRGPAFQARIQRTFQPAWDCLFGLITSPLRPTRTENSRFWQRSAMRALSRSWRSITTGVRVFTTSTRTASWSSFVKIRRASCRIALRPWRC